MGRFTDLTGSTYGRITVLERAPDRVYSNGRRKVFWSCSCSCGSQKVIAADNLRRGDTVSCGCYNTEVLHGRKSALKESHPKEYVSWKAMRDRVRNHKKYILNGITCCSRWDTFEHFVEDMGTIPGSNFTLDRRDTKEGYCKENCRWVSKVDQAYNARKPSNNTTGVVGVSIVRGKYQANIGYKGRSLYLGLFPTLEEAAKVRKLAELKYYGYSPNY